MWRSQADAEGLTLLKADNTAGYFGVTHKPGQPKPYQARLRRGGKLVHLGSFATAEEAALCIAWSPEGRAAAKRPAAPALTSEEARQQAQAEGLTLLKADNKVGYFGVHHNPQASKSKPYEAKVWRGGKTVSLGYFATAEEAALCIARSPEGQAAAKRPAAAASLTSDEARQQAEAEGLTLRVADNTAGYFGVSLDKSCKTKPYRAQVSRDGKLVYLGAFATTEEAALCVARSEGQEAAKRAAAAPPLTDEEARQQAEAEGLTLLKADNKAGYCNVTLDQRSKTKPYLARVTRGGKQESLGYFATAEEAALCVARSPEGPAAAKKAAAAPLLTSEEAQQQAEAEGLTLLVANSKEAEEAAEEAAEEEEAEIVLIEAVEVVGTEAEEVEVVEVVRVVEHEGVDEGGRSEGRPKRRRSM